MSYAKDQAEFMRLAGQTVGEWNDGQAARYVAHLGEEAEECAVAWFQRDRVKLIDGAIDTIVIALGFLHSIGVDPDECWKAVHAANMRKVDGSCGEIVRRPDGQIGKPGGWYGPENDLRRIVRNGQAGG